MRMLQVWVEREDCKERAEKVNFFPLNFVDYATFFGLDSYDS